MRPGVVRFIGLRPTRREAIVAVQSAVLDPDEGLAGDHYRSRTTRSRQVTLIASEHLAAIASYLGRDLVRPEELRRNIVVSGVNLLALSRARFRLGTETADFHVCAACGVVPVATCMMGGARYAVINAHALDDLKGLQPMQTAMDFEGETTEARLARRLRHWTPEADGGA